MRATRWPVENALITRLSRRLSDTLNTSHSVNSTLSIINEDSIKTSGGRFAFGINLRRVNVNRVDSFHSIKSGSTGELDFMKNRKQGYRKVKCIKICDSISVICIRHRKRNY